MTKSIEEQAEEYALKKYPKLFVEFPKDFERDVNYPRRLLVKEIFIECAKARDAQWLKVVNELKMKLKTCENDYWFMTNLLERSTEKYVGDAVKDCIERMKFRKPIFDLTKSEQMLKEMGVEND